MFCVCACRLLYIYIDMLVVYIVNNINTPFIKKKKKIPISLFFPAISCLLSFIVQWITITSRGSGFDCTVANIEA